VRKEANSLLAVLVHERLYDFIRAAAPDGTECLLAGGAAQALAILADSPTDLVLIELCVEGGGEALCRRIRDACPDRAIQVVVIADSYGPAEIALLSGFDDALLSSARSEDFRLALRAAFLRRLRNALVLREREFYRIAVWREENLSSKLLDEQLALKESIRRLAASKEAERLQEKAETASAQR